MLDRVLTPSAAAVFHGGTPVASRPVAGNRVISIRRYDFAQVHDWDTMSTSAAHRDLISSTLIERDGVLALKADSQFRQAHAYVFGPASANTGHPFNLSGADWRQVGRDDPEVSAEFQKHLPEVVEKYKRSANGTDLLLLSPTLVSMSFATLAAVYGIKFPAGSLDTDVRDFLAERSVSCGVYSGNPEPHDPRFCLEVINGVSVNVLRDDCIYFRVAKSGTIEGEVRSDPFAGASYYISRYASSNSPFSWGDSGTIVTYRVYVGDLIPPVTMVTPTAISSYADPYTGKVHQTDKLRFWTVRSDLVPTTFDMTDADKREWSGSLLSVAGANRLKGVYSRRWGYSYQQFGCSLYSSLPVFTSNAVLLSIDGHRCAELFSAVHLAHKGEDLSVEQRVGFEGIDRQSLWLTPDLLSPPSNWVEHSDVITAYGWSGSLWDAIKDKVVLDTAPPIGEEASTETFAQSVDRIKQMTPSSVFWSPRSTESIKSVGELPVFFTSVVEGPADSHPLILLRASVAGNPVALAEALSPLRGGGESLLRALLLPLTQDSSLAGTAVVGVAKTAQLGDYTASLGENSLYYFPAGQLPTVATPPPRVTQWENLISELVVELHRIGASTKLKVGAPTLGTMPKVGDLWFESASSPKQGDQNKRLRQLIGLELLTLPSGASQV